MDEGPEMLKKEQKIKEEKLKVNIKEAFVFMIKAKLSSENSNK